MQLPIRKRQEVVEKEIITKEFPLHAKVHVHVGDMVTPETVIADYESSRGFRIFHIAQALKCDPKALPKYLHKRVGDKVYVGDIIAERRRIGPLKPYHFRSTVNGVIQSVSPKGDMTISILPMHITQASLYWGKVIAVTGSDKETEKKPDDAPLPLKPKMVTIQIETQVIKLYGVMGSGGKREGRLNVLCDASDFLLPHYIDVSAENTIIVSGALVEHGVLERALKLKTTGIIGGGIHLGDAASMGMKSPSDKQYGTDIGISILATEGFGPSSISADQFEVLSKFNGRYVLLDGNAGVVTIPLKTEDLGTLKMIGLVTTATQVEASPGMYIRIIDPTDFGKIGRVTAISEKPEQLPSGLKDYMLDIAITTKAGETPIRVPASNVEVIY